MQMQAAFKQTDEPSFITPETEFNDYIQTACVPRLAVI